MSDGEDKLEVSYVYRAFGEQLRRLGQGEAKYSYGGKELDSATNLYYFNARFYDATTGRFINVDPVQDGTNWYSYCSNNPLGMVDPTGLINNIVPGVSDFDGLFQVPITDTVEVGSAVSPGFTAPSGRYITRSEVANAGKQVNTAKESLSQAKSPGSSTLPGAATKTPGQLGKEGEAAVRAINNIGDKTAVNVNGRGRIPDGLTAQTLSEVKNVKSQSFTQQLRDFLDYATSNGLRMDLYVRPTTKLSEPLLQETRINIRNIPE